MIRFLLLLASPLFLFSALQYSNQRVYGNLNDFSCLSSCYVTLTLDGRTVKTLTASNFYSAVLGQYRYGDVVTADCIVDSYGITFRDCVIYPKKGNSNVSRPTNSASSLPPGTIEFELK